VRAQLAALGCDPIEGMAKIAMDAANPPELRGKMFAELAGYVAPKRKAIDHSSDDGSMAPKMTGIIVRFVRPDEGADLIGLEE
jgi:hypothetical protein